MTQPLNPDTVEFIAVAKGLALWIFNKPAAQEAFYRLALSRADNLEVLDGEDLVEGAFRATMTHKDKARILCLWHQDYLTGTGDESWGLVRISPPRGIASEIQISREVFERSIYVINQRLQGFTIDGAFIHRAHENGVHTLLAGRGKEAFHSSIAYIEGIAGSVDGSRTSVMCFGPVENLFALSQEVAREKKNLSSYVAAANTAVTSMHRKGIVSTTMFPEFRKQLEQFAKPEKLGDYDHVKVVAGAHQLPLDLRIRARGIPYDRWMEDDSPLSKAQRRILKSDAIDRHPLRIVGPGGSGKTLLMQLLVLKQFMRAVNESRPARLLYIVHSSPMVQMVRDRFSVLGLPETQDTQVLEIKTLSELGRERLALESTSVIDADAQQAKEFQLAQVRSALRETFAEEPKKVTESSLFAAVAANDELFDVLALLVMHEISTAIKGHGLTQDRQRYVQSERALSRLHGILKSEERGMLFRVFERYNEEVFERHGVLDSDDVALSLLGRLRTPVWELRRKTDGYDHVFVDEAQLFNENERRVFPLLTKSNSKFVPVVLALDEAQSVYTQTSAGLGTLGIPDVASENLASIHRSTRAIVELAFFVIQRATDLFGPEFPDFTGIAEYMEKDDHPIAALPIIETASEDSPNMGKFVVRRVRDLRKVNVRQIAIICHAEKEWNSLLSELRESDLNVTLLEQRGQRMPQDSPCVVLARPLAVGGQEFDAVVLVGLEQGVTPPRTDNEALAAAVEQQALREIYLAITRARFRVVVAISHGATVTRVLREAEKHDLIMRTAKS